MEPIVVGISGASGVTLAVRLVRTLLKAQIPVALVVTENAYCTMDKEIGPEYAEKGSFLSQFSNEEKEFLIIYDNENLAASLASGSFITKAFVLIPCSMTTLSAVATGFGDTLLRRVAQVHLKEGRPFILVPRETPISEIHLGHLYSLSRMGAKVVLPVPGWYAKPKTIEDVERFIVGKVLDTLKIPNDLYSRWEF